jgi:ribosomal protein S18 acetylase RimI-like enzyme
VPFATTGVRAPNSTVGPHVNVRRALPSESRALSELALEAKGLWGYSAAQLAAWANELRISPETIVSEPTFVIEEEARIVGVVQLNTRNEPWSIEHLWVHPAVGRRGIGGLLVRHVLRYAHERGQRELQVDADPEAEQFYLQLGGRKVGEVAAPIEGRPYRVRPQLIVDTENTALPP